MAYGYCDTESGFAAWLQKSLRQVWSKHPSKVSLIRSRQISLKVGPNNKAIYHIQCYHCKQLFKIRDIECNHKKQVGGLTKLEDRYRFLDNLLLVQPEDLELLCKDCHAIVTYMERYNVSRRDAIIEKKCIAFSKLSDEEQIEKCKLAKFKDIPKTKKGRKDAVRKYLKRVMPK